MIRPVTGPPVITTNFGDSPDPGVFGKHAGTDYGRKIGTPVYSPVTGTVTASYKGSTGNIVEVTADGKSHRMLHMSRRDVGVGANVKEGQQVGLSGTYGTGPHLHWDVRKAGTAWDASFSNYYDPEKLIASQGGDMSDIIDDGDVGILRILHSEIGGWNFDETHSGKNDATFMKAWKGKSLRECINTQWKNGEAFRNARNVAMKPDSSVTVLKPGKYKVN